MCPEVSRKEPGQGAEEVPMPEPGVGTHKSKKLEPQSGNEGREQGTLHLGLNGHALDQCEVPTLEQKGAGATLAAICPLGKNGTGNV